VRPRRALPLLLALALCATAGCTGVFGTDHTAPSFAPGVSTERVTNATALAHAHRAVLANTSYTYAANATQRLGENYTATYLTREWIATNGSFRYRGRSVVENGDHRSDSLSGVWTNGSIALRRTVNVSNGTVTYTRYRPQAPLPVPNATRTRIRQVFVGPNTTVTRTQNASGHAFATVVANESRTSRTALANGTITNVTRDRRANATVRSDGLVPELDVSERGYRPFPGANGSVRYSDESHVRYAGLGSTVVGRPPWVETALNATAGLRYGEKTAPRSWNGSAENAST